MDSYIILRKATGRKVMLYLNKKGAWVRNAQGGTEHFMTLAEYLTVMSGLKVHCDAKYIDNIFNISKRGKMVKW